MKALLYPINRLKIQRAISNIASGKCAANQLIELPNTGMNDDDVNALIKAILSGNCPDGLRFNLVNNKGISQVGARALIDALNAENAPQGLAFYFGENRSDHNPTDAITPGLFCDIKRLSMDNHYKYLFFIAYSNLFSTVVSELKLKICQDALGTILKYLVNAQPNHNQPSLNDTEYAKKIVLKFFDKERLGTIPQYQEASELNADVQAAVMK
jgi:hypothetical protein